MASWLGLAGTGHHAPLMRSLRRPIRFYLALQVDEPTLAVRRRGPPPPATTSWSASSTPPAPSPTTATATPTALCPPTTPTRWPRRTPTPWRRYGCCGVTATPSSWGPPTPPTSTGWWRCTGPDRDQ